MVTTPSIHYNSQLPITNYLPFPYLTIIAPLPSLTDLSKVEVMHIYWHHIPFMQYNNCQHIHSHLIMSSSISRHSLSPLKPKSCCKRSLSFYEDFIIIGSPKRVLESYDDQSVQGEPETKRFRHSELAKPSECPQCGSLFPDAKRLKQHRRLHTADAVMLSLLGQDRC